MTTQEPEELEPKELKEFDFVVKRVTTPTVIQMEALECGAASLGIIMSYYKLFMPLEKLRVECGVSRDGSKAINMVKAAQKYGFDVLAERHELEGLKKIKPPYVIFWNFNHFLVVEGIEKNKVYLNDPDSGPRVVSFEEFNTSFTGIVLQFTPGKDFHPGGSPPGISKSLINRSEGIMPSVFYLILVGIALVIPGMLAPIFSKVFVDKFLILKLHSWLSPLLIGMGVTLVIQMLLSWLRQYYLIKLKLTLAIKESGKFLWHVLKLPMTFFSQRLAGDISNRISLNNEIANVISSDFTEVIINSIMASFYLILMLYLNISLTGVVVLIAVTNIVVMRFISTIRKNKSRELSVQQGKFFGSMFAGLFVMETIKASGRENDLFSTIIGGQSRILNIAQYLQSKTAALTNLPVLLQSLSVALILGIGGFFVINGHITIGTLVAFQALMGSFLSPVNLLVNTIGKFQTLEGNMLRLDDVFNYQALPLPLVESRSKEEIEKERKLSGYLELKNITFGYSLLEPPLVENFELKIQPGSRVAIVGASGSGKSTIARLIMQLYAPWAGEIFLDGEKIDHWPRDVLTSSLALVDQDIIMFDGTIRENLTMWDRSISEQQIISAAKDALIHSDITARPGGYDAMVREGGTNFSGGQRQRLENARALVSNPRIVVMDEATSALDSITEMEIDNNLRRRGCTTVVIAHRLSTIRDSDQIIVLDKGKIVEQGKHDELVQAKGIYAELISTTG